MTTFDGPAGAAPFGRIVAALTVHELRLAFRRGESLLATFVIPVAVLLFFAWVPVLEQDPGVEDGLLPLPHVVAARALLPGVIALSIVASSLVALGIATGYDRAYGVLKRLGGSPASRPAVVTARILATVFVEVAQVVLLILVATFGLAWSPVLDTSPLLLVGAVGLGTAAFSGLGLLLAGTLRAEATLALTNGLFLVALLLGGVIVPIDRLPGPIEAVAVVLPSAPLVETLRIALGSSAGDATRPLLMLAGWAAALVALAAWRFRWD